jgi:hypothetical protein
MELRAFRLPRDYLSVGIYATCNDSRSIWLVSTREQLAPNQIPQTGSIVNTYSQTLISYASKTQPCARHPYRIVESEHGGRRMAFSLDLFFAS